MDIEKFLLYCATFIRSVFVREPKFLKKYSSLEAGVYILVLAGDV